MINIEKSVVVDKSPDDVFAFVSDGSNTPSWQGGLEAVEGPTNVVGSRYTEVRKFMGREMRSLLEVTAFEPGSRWAARVIKGPVPYDVSLRVDPQDGGTRVTTHVEGETTGFFKVAEGMVKSQLEKSLSEDLERLKKLLEGE